MRLLDPDIWHEVTAGGIGRTMSPHLRVTPLVPAPALSQITGAEVWLKLESLQRTGSFKLRGALARLSALSTLHPGARVITASAGNHGLGIALAARTFGLHATVLVSALSPAIKRDGIAALGAQVEIAGPTFDTAEIEARRRATLDPGLFFVSSFDDDHVIAGNGGHLAREILEQQPDVQTVMAPMGGGGLCGGLGAFLAPKGVSVIGVSPAANAAMHQSLSDGRAHSAYTGASTLAEGLEGGVSERTFALARAYVPTIALVSESEIRKAVAFAYRNLGVVCEPSAAVVVAALLAHERRMQGTRVVAVITGANLDSSRLDTLLST